MSTLAWASPDLLKVGVSNPANFFNFQIGSGGLSMLATGHPDLNTTVLGPLSAVYPDPSPALKFVRRNRQSGDGRVLHEEKVDFTFFDRMSLDPPGVQGSVLVYLIASKRSRPTSFMLLSGLPSRFLRLCGVRYSISPFALQ